MKILLTGASGVLGTRLLESLKSYDIELRALVHKTPLKVDKVDTIIGSLDDSDILDLATQGMHTVVHLAAVTHSNNAEEYLKTNWEGCRNLYESCTRNGVQRFVFMGSRASSEVGGPYSLSKYKAEEFIKKGPIPWVVLRPAEVYGPGSPDAINQLIQWIKKFRIVPIIGNGEYKLSPVLIDDVIPAFIKAILKSEITGEIFTFCGPEIMTFKELVDRLSRILKIRPISLFIPAGFMKAMISILVACGIYILTKDQVLRLVCDKEGDNENAKKLLDYNPKALEDGLKSIL